MLYILSFIFLLISIAVTLTGYLNLEEETTRKGRHMFYAFVVSFLFAYAMNTLLQASSGCECVLT